MDFKTKQVTAGIFISAYRDIYISLQGIGQWYFGIM
jgi:hypothetical protein